LDSPSLNHR